MNNDQSNINNKNAFYRKLSLRQRISLLICFLLCGVITIFSLISYLGFRNLELKAGETRLISLSAQTSTMIGESVKDYIINAKELVPENIILQYLKQSTTIGQDPIITFLHQLTGENSTMYTELRDRNFQTLLWAKKDPEYSPPKNLIFSSDSTLQGWTGNFFQINDSVYYPVIIPISENKVVLGYIIRHRVVNITSKLFHQFHAIAGNGAATYIGNKDGSLWTDLIRQIPYQLPISPFGEGKTFEHLQNNNQKFIGIAQSIPGTPWLILLESPKDTFANTSNQFLNWLIFTGLILIGISMAASWFISRHLTQPLTALSIAAETIADGYLTPTFEIHGNDEVGRLKAYFITMSEKLKNTQKIIENQILESEQMNEQLRTLSAHMEKVREEERLHIARDMHDELGQFLTGFKMDIYLLKKKLAGVNDPAVTEKIQSLETIAGDAIQFVRKLSSELRMGPLEELGLVAALEWYCTEFTNRYKIPVKFSSAVSNLNFSSHIKTGVFRILQESLTNIARHANATQAEVNLHVNNQQLTLTIQDNGKGFNTDKTEKEKTLGILGMKERALMIGGSLHIQSEANNGTLIQLCIPAYKDTQLLNQDNGSSV